MSDTIDEISLIRIRNNALWMTILRIALDSSPTRTKKVLTAINDNDQKISRLLRELVK